MKIKVLILFLVIGGIMSSCIRRNESAVGSGIRTSQLELQHVSRLDSSEVTSLQYFGFHRSELDSFLVDMDSFVLINTLFPTDCEWYCLKTVDNIDTSLNCDIVIDLPSTNSWKINALIKRELFAQKDLFLSELNNLRLQDDPFVLDDSYRSEFNARLISAHQDSLYFSFCFSVYSYSAGAAHGMPALYSFSFDKRSKQRITFNDLFELESKEDSLLMQEIVLASLNSGKMHLNDVYEFDFNFKDSYLVFNFDAYEVTGFAYGTPRAPLNRKALFARFGRSQEL